MRLLVNALLLLAIALPAPLAQAKRKDTGKPTVVVMDIGVSSENPKVKQKIVELTAKVRDQIADQTTSCNVYKTRKMRQLARKHKKKIANCYDDCGVEFGLLVGADFVITGQLEPSSQGILAVIEIRDTRNRNIVSTKKVRGGNYFELERSLLSAVRQIVKPLNNVVMQATDDEVVRDREPEEDEAPSSGITASPAASQPQSEYLAPEEEEEEEELTPMGERWLEAQQAPPLMEEEDDLDDEVQLLGLGLGVNAGYSLNVSRNRHVRDLYKPVVHVGISAYVQVHPLLQIALVADLDFLKGEYYADLGFHDYVPEFDVAITSESNQYQMEGYKAIGLRPTVRLTFPVGMAEPFLGVGAGISYVSTSGAWVRQQSVTVYDDATGANDFTEAVPYYFDLSTWVFYAVVDFGLMFRLMDDRFGAGAFVQYKMPSMFRSGTDAEAKPNLVAANTSDPPFDTPTTEDTTKSPIRHLDSINLLTFGVMLDWRF